jgi:ADP-ribose pyrophosphatase
MKIIEKKVLWEGKFIRAVELTYLDKGGKLHKWEAVERIHSDSVALIIPLTLSGDLILIKQYRPALDRMVVELPAGLVDDGESPADTARRELIEETGFTSLRLSPLSEAAMSSGIHGEPWHVFLATGCTPATENELATHSPDDNEDIEPFTVPLASYKDELARYSQEGLLIDIRIYGLVELAKDALKGDG